MPYKTYGVKLFETTVGRLDWLQIKHINVSMCK